MTDYDENLEGDSGVAIQDRVKTQKPPMYKVVMLNDDYTTMEFVIEILEEIFHKNHQEAHVIMMQIHRQGSGVCGIYTKEIAETKVDQVMRRAGEADCPLQCLMEPAS